MPLLRKSAFRRIPPPDDVRPDERVFFCDATKEVFRDYDAFFGRTILCNSLVWSCSATGKQGLTYEEAQESEKRAKKRLSGLDRALKKGLCWCAGKTRRGRLGDLVDDVYKFCSNRFFKGEAVEAIVDDAWRDCRVVEVIPPTVEEEEEASKADKDEDDSPNSKKKAFSPSDLLFKYKVQEIEEGEEGEERPIVTVTIEQIRREKSAYTREKNLLFLKNIVELGGDGNFAIKTSLREKHKIGEIRFDEIFAGSEPAFEETKRLKGMSASTSSLGSKKNKQQGTLDNWMKGTKDKLANNVKSTKKQSPAEIEAEMRRIQEQNARFKEEMRVRAEEARKRKLEDKAKEKERKKEEKKLFNELMSEWTKPKEDLTCEDHKELPVPQHVHCKIPNHLFGDFLTILEFFSTFTEILEVKDSFPQGITFEVLESAVTSSKALSGDFNDILSFALGVLFDLQREEEEEVKTNKNSVNADMIDKNILGKDVNVANQIRSATETLRWSRKHQGQELSDLHLDQWSISEILRLHLESAGAFRGDKLGLWRYQQRGGYRLSDDPGLRFRMDEPQILEALTRKTVFELTVHEKLKIMNCLIEQILSFASIRDEVDERFHNYSEAKSELRNHQINENKRQRLVEESKKAKLREEKKKEDESKEAETTNNANDNQADAHLTTRQKEALTGQKEKEEKDRQRKEDILRSEAGEKEKLLMSQVIEVQSRVTMSCLGRDRGYRRFWVLDTIPGIFVENDDDFVGPCLPDPTPYNPNAGPIDEATAMNRVKEIMSARDKQKQEKASFSDKENDNKEEASSKDVKSYSRKSQQKVLSAKNGSLVTEALNGETEEGSASSGGAQNDTEVKKEEPSDLNRPTGVCTADMESCPVHSVILPKTRWSYFGKVEHLAELIDNLNPRGIREKELRDKLIAEREKLTKNLKKFDMDDKLFRIEEDDKKVNGIKTEENGTDDESSVSAMVDLTLRDQIMELEEKIFFGSLGSLKVRSREKWQNSIQEGNYDKQCEALNWGGKGSAVQDPFESKAESRNGSRSESPVNGVSPVEYQKRLRGLACALLQVGQMVDSKYLKEPLCEGEKEKKKRLKEDEKRRNKEKDNEDEEGSTNVDDETLAPFQQWEKSLMSSTSCAQLFIHMITLESSVIWSKSVMNTKCRICRRKTDPEKMLLCDGCDRGHHMYCLKPKLKSVPEGDWYCGDCKPKERNIRSPKKSRRVFSTTEDDESQGDETEDESKENEEGEDVNGDDERVSSEEEEEDEDSPRQKRHKKAAAKGGKKSLEAAPPAKKRKTTITQLLGKRRSAATEANERISKVANETSSGNSSGAENAPTERSSSRVSARNKVRRNLDNDSPTAAATVTKKRKFEQANLEFNPTVMEDLLNGMMKHKDGWAFDRPITKVDAPDYHKIIKRPIDLGTIRSGINRMKYSSDVQVLDDIKLVFRNCYTYNRDDAEEYVCGVRLEKFFTKEVNKLGLGHLLSDEEQREQKPSKRGRRTL